MFFKNFARKKCLVEDRELNCFSLAETGQIRKMEALGETKVAELTILVLQPVSQMG